MPDLTSILAAYPAQALALATLGLMAGGFTKGVVGFSLPMISISIMATALAVEQAVAILIIPSLVVNVWQILRDGAAEAVGTVRRYWLLNLVLAVGIWLSAGALVALRNDILLALLGAVVCLFAGVQLAGWRMPKPPGSRNLGEVLIGVVAGLLGGVTGIWGPPVLMYLISRDTAKTEQIRILGLVFFTGSAAMLTAHLDTGALDRDTIAISLVGILPVAVGMALGQMLQDRLDPVRFRNATLVVLCLAGANLLRRALF